MNRVTPSLRQRPIGIFDSGVGGLTVAREALRQLPGESLIYLGDTARVPYGPRGAATITRFALELAQFLLERDVKALVVACNSISAAAIEAIQLLSPVPVVDVIGPTVRAAVAASRSGVIGVAGTVATVSSGVYERQAKALRAEVRIEAQACPLFVPIAEEGLAAHPVARLMAEEYCGRLRESGVDVLILGCTHYPLLKEPLAAVLGPRVRLIDSAEPTVRALAALLRSRELDRPAPGDAAAGPRGWERGFAPAELRHQLPARHRFYVTDASYKFLQVANAILGADVSDLVEQVSVELPPGAAAAAGAAPVTAGRA